MARPPAKYKDLTPMQQAFLEALSGDAKGDLKKAKKLAGYSDNTKLNEIIGPLKDHIIEISRNILAMGSIKASLTLIDILDSPNKLGAKTAIEAAKQVLDRTGVISEAEENRAMNNTGVIVIMPPKKVVDDDDVF